MKIIICDICGKKIRSYYDYLFKMRIELPKAIDTEDPKYHLCEDCYGDMIKFMNGIRNELKRDKGGADCMDEDAKQASIPYTYNAPQHDWKCGYPDITRGKGGAE